MRLILASIVSANSSPHPGSVALCGFSSRIWLMATWMMLNNNKIHTCIASRNDHPCWTTYQPSPSQIECRQLHWDPLLHQTIHWCSSHAPESTRFEPPASTVVPTDDQMIYLTIHPAVVDSCCALPCAKIVIVTSSCIAWQFGFRCQVYSPLPLISWVDVS